MISLAKFVGNGVGEKAAGKLRFVLISSSRTSISRRSNLSSTSCRIEKCPRNAIFGRGFVSSSSSFSSFSSFCNLRSSSSSSSFSFVEKRMLSSPTMTKKTALVAIAEDSEDLETVAIVNVLRRAGVDVTIASTAADASHPIKMARGCHFVPDSTLSAEKSRHFDVVIVPGGMPGARHLHENAEMNEILAKQNERGGWIAAICAAPAVVLAPLGLLKGKRATCYPSFEDKLNGGVHSEDKVVTDGHVITSKGPGTAILFGLEIVKVVVGEDKSREVGQQMLVDGY